MSQKFTADLVAPCGINCGICKAYLAYSRGVPRKKGEVSHCTGCIRAQKLRLHQKRLPKNPHRTIPLLPPMPRYALRKISQT
jgi:hypothetical protein